MIRLKIISFLLLLASAICAQDQVFVDPRDGNQCPIVDSARDNGIQVVVSEAEKLH